MWEVFLGGVMSGSSVAIILLESSKAFTTHQVKNTSWNRLNVLPVKCTEKETPSSRSFRRERSSSETAKSAPDVEPEESKGWKRSSKA